jgi:hypothetical protein
MTRHEGGWGGGILYSMHTSISLSPMQSDTPLPVPPRLPSVQFNNHTEGFDVAALHL